MHKFSIVIPTMQKNVDVLNMLITELVECSVVGEIIVIDNSLKKYSYNSDKVRVIVPKKNLYVNPAWNLGIKEAKFDYFGILNDDLLIPKNLLEEVLKFLTNQENAGVVGLNSDTLFNTPPEEFNEYPCDKEVKFSVMDKTISTQYWGSAFFGEKSRYFEIPRKIKIWCGDNYQLKRNRDSGRQNWQIDNIEIKHIHSLTSSDKAFKKIKEKDIYLYAKIDKEFLKHTMYKKRSLLKNIFSVTNSSDKKHKILTILGITIKFRKYNSSKYKQEYFEYCAYNINQNNPNFVEYKKHDADKNDLTKLIAFYLPQYHTFEENEIWHGKGFTE